MSKEKCVRGDEHHSRHLSNCRFSIRIQDSLITLRRNIRLDSHSLSRTLHRHLLSWRYARLDEGNDDGEDLLVGDGAITEQSNQVDPASFEFFRDFSAFQNDHASEDYEFDVESSMSEASSSDEDDYSGPTGRVRKWWKRHVHLIHPRNPRKIKWDLLVGFIILWTVRLHFL